MKIAIIGTGRVGSAIAHGLKGKGLQVVLGSRKTQSTEMLALAQATGSTLAEPAAAAASADIIILALPWAQAEAAVKDLGDLSGKIVVDCMNPLVMVDGLLSLGLGHTTSGAEVLQSWIPGARVVKTLNQVGAEIMADAGVLPHKPVQFMASDDEGAKLAVAGLLEALGFEALDAGGLTRARILEPFAMVWINQALIRGKGRNWAFAAVSAHPA